MKSEPTNKYQLNESISLSVYFTVLLVKLFIHYIRLGVMFLDAYIIIPKDKLQFPINEKYTKKFQELVKDTSVNIHLDKTWNVINAYTFGDNNIYYTRKIEQLLTEDELMSVFIHEYGHIKEKHVKKLTIKDEFLHLLSSPLFTLQFLLVEEIPGIFIFWITFIGNIIGQPLLKHMLMYKDYQKAEYEADSWSKKYGYNEYLIFSFKKMQKIYEKELCQELSKTECELEIQKLHKFSTHPSFKDRINKLSEKILSISKKIGAYKTLKALHMVVSNLNKSIIERKKIGNVNI